MAPAAADAAFSEPRTPSRAVRRWLPWGAWAMALCLTAASIAFLVLSDHVSLGPRWGPRGGLIIFAVMFSMMGLVVTTRQPQNRIGWLYLAAGCVFAVQGFGEEYAAYALLARPGELPGGVGWAWLQNWIWILGVSIYLIYVPLLLPDGRLLSSHWRRVGWFGGLATGLLSFFFATQPGRLSNFYPVVNPLGIHTWPRLWSRLETLALALMSLAMAIAVASLVVRVRHAGPMERQQLKWVAFACAWAAAGMLAAVVFGTNTRLSEILVIGGIVGTHFATALAILRYRLYDIDIVIRRTLVYGMLTAALAAVYFACVVVLQTLAVRLTGQPKSQLVTVLSTLAMAALAAPLRARLQLGIDRRFYRYKYDAAQSLARFGRAVRDSAHADLDQLSDDILAVVNETLQPASATLWVRPKGGGKL
jgi:hypothetical protein